MENRDYRRYTTTNKKKPIMINLVAAAIGCLVAFILGFAISSFALLDSRITDRDEKISQLEETIEAKDEEIKELNSTIDKKSGENILLAEKIAEHEDTIEQLKIDPTYTPATKPSASDSGTSSSNTITSFSKLSTSQQLILVALLFVLIIFIISLTCGIIAAKSPKKKRSKATKASVDSAIDETAYPEEELPPLSEYENPEYSDSFPEAVSALGEDMEVDTEPTSPVQETFDPIVDEAIDLLYHNNLEDNISDLGGFRFGITNFDEVLSDKAKGKSFGNAENGDFVAFMAVKASVKKLYIIPRYLTLSDSSVALRGTTDLFDIVDEGGNTVSHGTVNIKSINAPAVFSLGDSGWAIESKGSISSFGFNSI